MKNIISLLLSLLISTVVYAKSIPAITPAEIASTSMQGGTCAPAPSKIYRCVRKNFFPALRIIQNMIGDETAEHPSWRLTALLKKSHASPGDLKDYRRAKRKIIEQLQEEKEQHPSNACETINQEAIDLTFGMKGVYRDSKDAIGIMASDSLPYTEFYCLDDVTATFLVIEEKTPRSTYAVSSKVYSGTVANEVVIPGFIPANDLVGGYTNDFAIEKTQSDTHQTEIIFKRRIAKGFTAMKTGKSCVNDAEPKALFKIMECSGPADCASDPVALSDAEGYVPSLTQALTDGYIRNNFFKVVSGESFQISK